MSCVRHVYIRLHSEVKRRCLFTSAKLHLVSSLRKLNNWNSVKVYLVVCGCLLVICGRFLMVCGRLWSFPVFMSWMLNRHKYGLHSKFKHSNFGNTKSNQWQIVLVDNMCSRPDLFQRVLETVLKNFVNTQESSSSFTRDLGDLGLQTKELMYKLFLWNGWPNKDVKPHFQPQSFRALPEVLTVASPWQMQTGFEFILRRIWVPVLLNDRSSHWMCFIKKGVSQNSQENNYFGVSF